MEVTNLLTFTHRQELRDWLMEHHDSERECWVTIKRRKPDGSALWYLDAVEEALCFGWIDSTCKKVSDTVTAQRFGPRTPRSSWTELNKERCRKLINLGLMTEAGLRVLPPMHEESFTIDADILSALEADEQVWNNCCNQPKLYRRIRIANIQSERSRPDTFRKRLEKYIDATRRGELYGDWNDGGRLFINRVVRMEQLHDIVRAAVDARDKARLAELKKDIQELQHYYYDGEWLVDFDADNEGLFPKDLKRGILAEDTLYDLFIDIERF